MSWSGVTRTGARAGFTLVELLVAITILGLLMGAAFGALRLGSRSLEEGVRRADRTEEIRSSADFLRRQLAQLVPLSLEADGRRELAFDGGPVALRFVTTAPAGVQGTGLLLMTLSVEGGAGDASLRLGIAPYLPGDDAPFEREPARSVTLLRGLAEASIRYYGAMDDDDTPAWHDAWAADAKRYPAAVRVAVSPHEGEPPLPDLLLRIRPEELR